MKTTHRILGRARAHRSSLSHALAAALAALLLLATTTHAAEQVMTLEKFITTETALQPADSLLQNSRPVDSVFLGSQSLMDTPRAVTLLSPELMKQLAIKNFSDLDRVGAGLTRPNIFGLPGLPFIRGDNATVFFNGMRRIPNQNETPTSFGSLDAMDLVKGPAPAHFGPTNAGGYANFIPKSPYFDKFRGSVALTAGSYDYYNTQVDVGGPVLFLDKPMAYRVSITNQQAKSYYDRLRNDYLSVYASAKARLSPKLTFFTGGEYYNFRSNENAGWNRLTQDLVNNGNYIYGDMDPNTTSAAYRGFVDNASIGFVPSQIALGGGFGFPIRNYDPALAIVVPSKDFQARFGTPNGTGNAYTTGAAAQALVVNFNGQLVGYKYTPGYFGAGGQLFTKKIEGNQVVSDSSDFANSKTYIWFADFAYEASAERTFTLKSLVESLSTRKISSYGFAHDSDSTALEQKLVVDEKRTVGGMPLGLQYGADLRYTYNNDANDFGVEPFGRRDVSNPTIVPQSVVLVGPQVKWPAGYVGGSRSTLFQAGVFAQAALKVSDSFSVFAGGRYENANWELRTPKEFTPQNPKTKGNVDYGSISVNPILKVNDLLSLYAVVQQGTVLNAGQTGGVNGGDGNFNESPFYEGGAKVSLLGGKVFATAAVYQFEKTTLAELPIGGLDSVRYESEGFELELSANPIKGLTVLASYGEQETRTPNSFPFTTRPFTAQDVALYSGAIQYGQGGVFTPTPGTAAASPRFAANPKGIRSGYPLKSANLFVIYTFDNGFGFGAGPSWKSSFWNDNERTIRLPAATVWNANLFYKTKRWETTLRLSNVTDEDYFIGSTFAPTMIVTKAEPFQTQLTVTLKF